MLRGDGEDELGRPENRGGQRAVFGLAAGPCSGGLALCLRSSYLDGHSTGRAVPRVEAWRLLLATVPLPLMSGQGATSSAADLMSAPKVPTDHWSTSPGRPLGASMWAVAASLLALPADQCASELERLESAAVSELRSTDETADGDSDGASQAREYALRGLQIVVALACECGSRPWTMRQMRAEDDDDGDAGSEEPSTSADGDEEAATELDAQLQRISKQISERCARLLLDVQAASHFWRLRHRCNRRVPLATAVLRHPMRRPAYQLPTGSSHQAHASRARSRMLEWPPFARAFRRQGAQWAGPRSLPSQRIALLAPCHAESRA